MNVLPILLAIADNLSTASAVIAIVTGAVLVCLLITSMFAAGDDDLTDVVKRLAAWIGAAFVCALLLSIVTPSANGIARAREALHGKP